MTNLNLYALVEDLLGIEEATSNLHNVYVDELKERNVKSILDLGCGRGLLMESLISEGIEAEGIDLSSLMVEDAKAKGLKVEHKDISQVDKKYDAIVAVFDVLNFIEPEELEKFFSDVANSLNDNALFIADVNTLHGFSNVAEGVMSVDAESRFLNIDAVFDENILHTTFTLFIEGENGSFKKEQNSITQYFHPMKAFKKTKDLKLIKNYPMSLYDEDDKQLLIFKKTK